MIPTLDEKRYHYLIFVLTSGDKALEFQNVNIDFNQYRSKTQNEFHTLTLFRFLNLTVLDTWFPEPQNGLN